MKLLKIMVVSLSLMVIAGVSACGIGQKANTESQTTISKGDIRVTVNGTGKTSYARDAKLAFGTAGKIEKLNVQKGDAVTEDTVLAQLETENLELALSQAKVAEAAAKVGVVQAGMAVTQAEIGVTQTQQALGQAESAQTQAEAALTAAQFNLDRIQAVSDIKDQIMGTQIAITTAEENRKFAGATQNSEHFSYLNRHLTELYDELNRKNTDLQKLLAKEEYSNVAPYEIMTFDPLDQTFSLGGQKYNRLLVEDIQMKQQQVVIAQQSIEQGKQAILKAQQDIEQAKQNVERSRQSVEQATLTLQQSTKAVEVAQKQLNSAVIVAPFDGIIASLDITQNDYIITAGLSAGTPVYMVEPDSLEINAEIDEMDIAAVQVGQKALITMDAVSGIQIEGVVTSISYLPVVKPLGSGVVVYEVKVGFSGTPPAWAKSGMSASVDITTAEKKGVVVVPNKSIKQNSQGQKIVNSLANTKSQEKIVTVGLSNGSQSEIISGISEGEVILGNP